jgi:glycosyltransferase involved in cell wall biosynthesis
MVVPESSKPRVVVVRGHQANSWHLRPWGHLADRYDVVALRTRRNWFDTSAMDLPVKEAPALRDYLPKGRLFDQVSRIPGDRYVRPAEAFAGAAIIHTQDLGFWYSMQAARLRRKLGYKLVVTAWETIPFLHAYRNVRTRPYRDLVLREADLFLAATERARACLLLEGAPAERIKVIPPGVDRAMFTATPPETPPTEHVVLSAGRLVWEKGHQDLLRAVAAIRRGLDGLRRPTAPVRVLIIGRGPDEDKLRHYADELGIGDAVEVRAEVPYAEMVGVYERATCLVLGSLPTWFWEEQFGMVLAEAICAQLPVVAANSGAIAEVLDGNARLYPPQDWMALARQLSDGPLAGAPGTRAGYPESLVSAYSAETVAGAVGRAYDELLAD